MELLHKSCFIMQSCHLFLSLIAPLFHAILIISLVLCPFCRFLCSIFIAWATTLSIESFWRAVSYDLHTFRRLNILKVTKLLKMQYPQAEYEPKWVKGTALIRSFPSFSSNTWAAYKSILLDHDEISESHLSCFVVFFVSPLALSRKW